jgi:hypothetical protein
MIAAVLFVLAPLVTSLLPEDILELHDSWPTKAQEVRAKELWELSTAMPLRFLPVAMGGERPADVDEDLYRDWEGLWDRLPGILGSTSAGALNVRTKRPDSVSDAIFHPCNTPDRSTLLLAAQGVTASCRRSITTRRSTSWGSNPGRCRPSRRRTFLATPSWLSVVGIDSSDGMVSLALGRSFWYGKVLSYAARYWVKVCSNVPGGGTVTRSAARKAEAAAAAAQSAAVAVMSLEDPASAAAPGLGEIPRAPYDFDGDDFYEGDDEEDDDKDEDYTDGEGGIAAEAGDVDDRRKVWGAPFARTSEGFRYAMCDSHLGGAAPGMEIGGILAQKILTGLSRHPDPMDRRGRVVEEIRLTHMSDVALLATRALTDEGSCSRDHPAEEGRIAAAARDARRERLARLRDLEPDYPFRDTFYDGAGLRIDLLNRASAAPKLLQKRPPPPAVLDGALQADLGNDEE